MILIPLKEVYAIRLMIEEEKKGMTIEGRIAFTNERTASIMQQYNIKTASFIKQV